MIESLTCVVVSPLSCSSCSEQNRFRASHDIPRRDIDELETGAAAAADAGSSACFSSAGAAAAAGLGSSAFFSSAGAAAAAGADSSAFFSSAGAAAAAGAGSSAFFSSAGAAASQLPLAPFNLNYTAE